MYHIYSVLKKGSQSTQVTQLQRSLPAWTSSEPLATDGIFGSKTEKAVEAFQSAMELTADGVVGKATASVLGLWTEIEEGFDASHWQEILWDEFEKGDLSFAIFKASQGATYKDPQFSKNVEQASRCGLDVGAYHFCSFQASPLAEAENFLESISGKPVDSVFLDLEADAPSDSFDFEEWISLWLAIVSASVPPRIEVGIYTSSRYLREKNLQAFTHLSKYALWGVNWSRQPMVVPWNQWSYWQYTSKGSMPWILGDVDLNRRVKKRLV